MKCPFCACEAPLYGYGAYGFEVCAACLIPGADAGELTDLGYVMRTEPGTYFEGRVVLTDTTSPLGAAYRRRSMSTDGHVRVTIDYDTRNSGSRIIADYEYHYSVYAEE